MAQEILDEITLRAGPLEMSLCPSKGGSISRLRYIFGGTVTPVLRGSDRPPENILDAGNFPLVPFVNRISGGTFRFRGRTVTLGPNMAGDPSPLHGQGWLSGWELISASDTEALIEFHHRAGEWPWEYRARQQFTLSPEALEIRLSCVNASADPMPCGLGQHPYFQCTDRTRLQTHVTHAWTIDEHVLPVERVAATGRFDLSDVAVCGLGLDHGFGGWDGRATMSDPAWPFELVMSGPDAGFFQLYSPSEGGLFVAEPVTHANDALSADEADWAELGMRILEPGEEMSLLTRLEVRGRAGD